MIEELRTFLTVSSVGSIQGASRQLPLTQSAITRQIQRLESELRCTLLDRSVKPPRLTRDGEEVRARGKRLVDEIDAFRTSFDPAAEPEGLLRLGIAHAALDWRGSSAIARSVVAMKRAYPKVTVRVSAGWTPRLIAEVLDGTLDAALVLGKAGAPWPPDVTTSTIAGDQLVAVAPRSLATSRRTAFADLFNQPWILNPDGCGYRSLLISLATSMGSPHRRRGAGGKPSARARCCRPGHRAHSGSCRADLGLAASGRQSPRRCEAEGRALCHHSGFDLDCDNAAPTTPNRSDVLRFERRVFPALRIIYGSGAVGN